MVRFGTKCLSEQHRELYTRESILRQGSLLTKLDANKLNTAKAVKIFTRPANEITGKLISMKQGKVLYHISL